MKKCVVISLVLAMSAVLCGGCGRGPGPAPGPAGARVVSLAPNLTEIVCAVGGGDLLVGRTDACDYPPDVVGRVPVVGGFGVPSMEKLLSVSPTLVLDVDLEDEMAGGRISRLGIRRERIACSRLDEIPGAVEKVGGLTGREAAAAALAGSLRARIAELRAQNRGISKRPSVYVEIWHDPKTTVGTNTFLSEIVALAGGHNIGDETDKDYYQVSSEWVVDRNPDVILCLYMSGGGASGKLVAERMGWRGMAAVRNGRIYDGFDNSVLLRPGPRVLEGVEALRRRILDGVPPDAAAGHGNSAK